MRLIAAAAAFAALVLLIACGDDNSPSTATPSPSPTEGAVAPGQQTPNPDACTRVDVIGRLVSTEGAAGHTFLTLEVSGAERDCVLTGPPEVRWYDADGAGLGVPFTPSAECGQDETDYVTCVFPSQVSMSPANASPAADATTAVRAVVSVTNIDVLVPCASPSKQAHIVGLQFPQVSLDVQVELPDDIEMQTCSAQVDLVGYGPVLTGG